VLFRSFFNRCPLAIENTCDKELPPIIKLKDGHEISCHLSLEELNATETETQKILHGYEKIGVDDPMPTAH
jgi:hypothetical protein